jgi:hypothetical protein
LGAGKAQAIVEKLNEMGIHASGPEVRDALARQGVDVGLPDVAAVRNRLQQRGDVAVIRASEALTGEHRDRPEASAEELAKVQEWARQVGGVERLRALCDVILHSGA